MSFNDLDNLYDPYRKQSLGMLVPITSTDKKSVQLKDGVWNSGELSSTEWIPNDAPESYKMFMRHKLSFLNNRAVFENLFFAGGITPSMFREAMDQNERALSKLRETYKYPAKSLLIVNQNDTQQPIQVKLFSDQYICDYYTKTVLGVSYNQIMLQQLPAHLNGTRVFDQEWYSSMDDISKSKATPEHLSGVPLIHDTNERL